MKHLDIVKSYYGPKLQLGGPDYRVLGWESSKAQEARFSVLVDYVVLQGKSLLDVGCGLGTLTRFLSRKKVKVRYTGVDILQDMVACAKERHPDHEFHCIDLFSKSKGMSGRYDVVYASGVFNLDFHDDGKFMETGVAKLIRIAKSTLVLNFLHHKSPTREKTYFYTSPERIVALLEKLPVRIKSLRIVEHYLKNDFTVICEKCTATERRGKCGKK